AALWSRLLEQYPYGIFADTPAARALRAAADCDLPYVRADWWVFAASRPPFYHDLLQLPATDKELERDLKVEVAADIQEERVARAGFNGSGVSQNNRLIERHRSSYGAYWKSYDFAANAGRKNLFAHPLGPGTEDRDFQQDGGEIIFNLPNGLQAYLLVDGRGRRLNEGPTKIVSVKNQPDPAVINGISCMYCHARGMIDKADQVREHAAKNPAAFSDADAQTIRALYPPEEEFRTLLHQDAERFERAMLQAGVQPGATEPVVALAGRFEAEVDLPTAAAEVGVPPTVLLQGLDKFPRLAQDLGPLKVAGGTVKRQVLVHAFPDLVLAFRLGTPLLLLNQAMARATAAIESNPANPEPYFQRGNIHFDKGAMEKASADYSEAIRLGLRTGAVFQNRGMAYATQGDPDRAIADYSEALKLDRRDGETYHNRGLAYAQKSDWAQALADLDNTIRLDPRDASAYSDRGFVQAQRHEWTKALADFQTALQLDPHSALTHGRQGDVYQALGDYDRAIAAYDQALRLNPGLVQVHLARERANTQRGKEKAQAPPRESP
ncbi:MAG: tetratricopeptide repeat protein, partial [Planctomycetes bacterium]|nr:tetratricopeptide repeat protein [Planctomycetota bacterium]